MEARRLHQDLSSCPSEEEQMKGWYQCEGVRQECSSLPVLLRNYLRQLGDQNIVLQGNTTPSRPTNSCSCRTAPGRNLPICLPLSKTILAVQFGTSNRGFSIPEVISSVASANHRTISKFLYFSRTHFSRSQKKREVTRTVSDSEYC